MSIFLYLLAVLHATMVDFTTIFKIHQIRMTNYVLPINRVCYGIDMLEILIIIIIIIMVMTSVGMQHVCSMRIALPSTA